MGKSIRIKKVFSSSFKESFMKKVSILFASAEVTPFAKVGGLADVAGSLPPAIKELGYDIQIVMPKYKTISEKDWGLVDSEKNIRIPGGQEKLDARVWTATLPASTVTVYLIEEKKFITSGGIYIENDASSGGSDPEFARINVFCSAIPELIKTFSLQPDIIHLNDWHVGLLPAFMQNAGYKTKHLLTIHNLAYQGIYSAEMAKKTLGHIFKKIQPLSITNGNINTLLNAILTADKINTVSPSYKEEILTTEFGAGLERFLYSRSADLSGILNGINTKEWDPEGDEDIASRFDISSLENKARNKENLQNSMRLPPEKNSLLFGMVSRLSEQKGFDILIPSLQNILKDLPCQVIILATGSPDIADRINVLKKEFPQKIVFIDKFNNALAHKIYGGSDAFLMPSRFEPCGLGQMIAMRYGTLPVAHSTGGLKDTVKNNETGFVFEKYKSETLLATLNKAVKIFNEQPAQWLSMQTQAMTQDFSWSASAQKYAQLYEKLINEA